MNASLSAASKKPSERRIVDVQDLGSTPFLVDPQTGAVQTNQSYGQYSDGYFQVTPHLKIKIHDLCVNFGEIIALLEKKVF